MGLEDVHDCSGWATGNRCGVCYVCRQTEVARAVRRVLRDDGTLFINLGDKYAGGGVRPTANNMHRHMKDAQRMDLPDCGVPKKNLLGIPWRVAFSLQADGWILRSDIIWHRVNAMPGSQKDRPSCAHEYIFLFSKQPRYFYDDVAIQEKAIEGTDLGLLRGKARSGDGADSKYISSHTSTIQTRLDAGVDSRTGNPSGQRTKRSVWAIPVGSEKGGHFAAYPEKLIMPCILAGTSSHGRCSKCYAPYKRLVERERVATRPGKDTKVTGDSAVEGNRDPERHITHVKTIGWEATCSCESDKVLPCIVLDPFCGTGTTLAAAIRKNRWAIGFELNPEYVEMAHEKIQKAISTKGFGF